DGTVPAPEGNVHASIVPYQTFRAADGFVNVCCANNALFERLCRAIELEELLDDPRFADNTSRVSHRGALVPLLEAKIGTLAKAEVVRKLREANVPVGPISDLAEVFNDPVVRHLGLIAEVDHPVAGRVRAPGIPVRMSDTPGSVRRYPPLLGEHTDEVLRPVGHAFSLFVPGYGYWQVHRHFRLIRDVLARAGGTAKVDPLSATLGVVLWSFTFLHYSNDPLFTVLNVVELAAATIVVVYGQRAMNDYWRARGTPTAERVLATDWLALAAAAIYFIFNLVGYVTAPTD